MIDTLQALEVRWLRLCRRLALIATPPPPGAFADDEDSESPDDQPPRPAEEFDDEDDETDDDYDDESNADRDNDDDASGPGEAALSEAPPADPEDERVIEGISGPTAGFGPGAPSGSAPGAISGSMPHRESPQALFEKLCVAYTRPPRKYHTLAHLTSCFSIFDAYRHLATAPDQVEYALWLHDIFYDPLRQDNEEISCAAASMFGAKLGLPTDFLAACAKLIIATKHDRQPTSSDGALLVDIDLSILGAPRDEYGRYTRAVRWEYGFATDEQFRAGRRRFLEMMLGREVIFRTDELRLRFEDRARENLRAELQRLAASA